MVQKVRMINLESRRWHQYQEETRPDPRAVVFVKPVPAEMSTQELSNIFSTFGRVLNIVRDDDDNEASVQFTVRQHAEIAVKALLANKMLGDGVELWQREVENEGMASDQWGSSWDMHAATGAMDPNSQNEAAELIEPP